MRIPFARNTLPVALAVITSAGTVQAQQLEEVIVTAQKREQSLQETPIAVSAFDAAAIDTQGISNVKDLALFVPNTQIVESPGGTSGATIAIRGAVTTNPAITWEPVVGMYLDGVFLGKNIGGIFEIADLERVEVLRGPQGTLYGKNTIGGAINLITRKPEEEFTVRVDASAGNEGYQKGKLRVDTGDMGGFRAAVSYANIQRDGFYDNEFMDPNGGFNPFPLGESSTDEFNDLDSESWRVDAIWDISDTFSARYTYDYSDRDNLPSKGQLTDVNHDLFEAQGIGFLADLLQGYVVPKDENADSISNDFAGYEKSETQGHALTLTWDAGNWGALGDVEVKSITAKRELDYDDAIDIDGTNMDLFHSGRDIEYDQLSQEFQLVGSTENVEYVLGAYYFEEEGDVVNDITFFGLFGRATDVNLYGLDNESIALYGQADWNLASIPQLTLSFGLRYTEEDREQYVVRPDTAEGGAGAYSGVDSDTWNNTSGAFVAAWDHNDDVNFYFRVAQGWKSGGFNGEAPTEDAFREGYDEETVLSYELGMKSRFADDRIQLNVALFQNNVDDKQVSVFLEGSGGAASNVANAGEQTAEGVEVEYIWQVADPLRFSFTYGYLDTEYDEFIQSGVDIKDQRDVAFSPKNSYSAAIDWTLFEASWGNLDFHLDYSYNDDYDPYIRPDQNATTSVDDYEVMNASLMLSEVRVGDSATMMFNLWGKNILDEEYTQHGIPFGFWTATYFGNPATYGIDVRLEF